VFNVTSISPSNCKFGYCDFTNDGRAFYVGIGSLQRAKVPARNKKHTNVALKHGLNRVIEVSGSWEEMCDWEKRTIQERNTFYGSTSISCNFTFGGDGMIGFKRIKSLEERKKISDSKKRLYANPEARKHLGEAIHQAKLDPIKHQNHCLAQQKRYADPVERERARQSNTQKKRVQQLTPDGVVIAEFSSMSLAVKTTGVLNIKMVCQGKRPYAGGFKWQYVVEEL
jgi:hypothetical protein